MQAQTMLSRSRTTTTMQQPAPSKEPKIVDVRLDSTPDDTTSAACLRSAIIQGLKQETNKKSLPTLLLYDERGLRIYDDITTGADEYYLFPLEEAILKNRGAEIVKAMHGDRGVVEGEVVLELGAGALRKTSHLLHNLASLVTKQNEAGDLPTNGAPPITYYALDLERRELVRGAGRALGDETLFEEANWEYVNFYNVAERRHEAYFKSRGPQKVGIPSLDGKTTEAVVEFAAEELVKIEVSHKYATSDISSLISDSNLRIIREWKDPQSLYSLFLLERPAFHFPLIRTTPTLTTTTDPKTLLDAPSDALSPFSIPTIKDWQELWKSWDTITLGMIPQAMLHEKPIDLRHKCLFYLGHIPAFLDIHLSRLLQEPHTEPENYKYIFERGIDPHVDDPTQCHGLAPHSEVPEKDEDWPALEEILGFRDRVRQRLLNLYDDLKTGKKVLNRKTARVLFMTLEHEGFHAETLLYMLIQRAGAGTLPPPKFPRPQFEELASVWDDEYTDFYASSIGGTSTSTITLGPQKISIGHNDLEADDALLPFDPTHAFGWDNEHPKREVQLQPFRISWRPVTNGEFRAYWADPAKNRGNDKVNMPASWVEDSDGKLRVRSLYGPVDFEVAKHWPVQAEYDDLSTYARVKGGRLPTLSELTAFYERFQGEFVGSGNVGFRNWHPTPATTGVKDGGAGHNGGVWEWTSTVLERHEGFVPSELYPGYSMDFFDTKHQVVIGGSYATIPRIAQRRSVCNFYQHNYPYAWIGARIVYDIDA
ncbi:hypothetical protein M422DRAFT_69010 [Sphaerobolus stellatus SS14]|uniref:Uncharacterized protein n=1 Tax=Sphaerobolus stellatus (strain SS14) TaxID=990650 RepID=A0A0C9U6W8_SPHS4|nr:hypothetical protein M422DRAFT_69010 [Sphaerobolus stellatus SS14]